MKIKDLTWLQLCWSPCEMLVFKTKRSQFQFRGSRSCTWKKEELEHLLVSIVGITLTALSSACLLRLLVFLDTNYVVSLFTTRSFLIRLPCRYSYPVFYRTLLQELVELVKGIKPGKATDSAQVGSCWGGRWGVLLICWYVGFGLRAAGSIAFVDGVCEVLPWLQTYQ